MLGAVITVISLRRLLADYRSTIPEGALSSFERLCLRFSTNQLFLAWWKYSIKVEAKGVSREKGFEQIE